MIFSSSFLADRHHEHLAIAVRPDRHFVRLKKPGRPAKFSAHRPARLTQMGQSARKRISKEAGSDLGKMENDARNRASPNKRIARMSGQMPKPSRVLPVDEIEPVKTASRNSSPALR